MSPKLARRPDQHRMRQFELRDEAGSTLICWLPDEGRIKVGHRLTLKGLPNRWWTVNVAYEATQLISELDFRRHWKVGGLT